MQRRVNRSVTCIIATTNWKLVTDWSKKLKVHLCVIIECHSYPSISAINQHTPALGQTSKQKEEGIGIHKIFPSPRQSRAFVLDFVGFNGLGIQHVYNDSNSTVSVFWTTNQHVSVRKRRIVSSNVTDIPENGHGYGHA